MFSSFAAQVQRTCAIGLLVAISLMSAFSSTPESKQKKARRTLPRGTPSLASSSNYPDVPFQRLGDLLFGHCTHNLLDDLPVLEQQQRRDSLHTISARRIHRFIHVQFHHFQLPRVVVRDLRHRRREHVARAAPFCPEIHHDRLRIAGRQHLSFEILVICSLNCIISHVVCSQWLARRLRATTNLSSIVLIRCSSTFLVSCRLP